ncbi:MAG: FHA domain-containing protein [Chloroflexi bacterium]|nr:FHA domain-containing protein [Chloroflexota bacterium]
MAEQTHFQLNITTPEEIWEHILTTGATVVGRSDACDLIINNPRVQRKHMRIDASTDACFITDLSRRRSRTNVNGEPIEPNTAVPLNFGDSIEIGDVKITVTQAAEQQPEIVDEPEAEGAESEVAAGKVAVETAVSGGGGSQPPANLMPDFLRSAPPPPPDYTQVSPPGLGRHSVRFLDYLPALYQSDFSSRFLAIFEAVLLPVSWNVDNFDMYLSPRTAPLPFLDWLASWFGVYFDSTWSEAKRRTLLLEINKLFSRHGTKWALSRLLEIYTGRPPEIIEAEQAPHTFTVKLPLRERDVNRKLVEQLIEANKPSHTNYVLEFDSKLDLDVMWSQLEF